jgi:threonine synthase
MGVIARWRDRLPVTDATPDLTLGEGDTPLVRSDRLGEKLGVELWFKFEGANPTGSFKDRGMCVAVAKAIEDGARGIVCASTGNTAASAAAYAARAGVPAVVLTPAGAIAPAKQAQARAVGARVLEVRGSFDDALRACLELTDFTIVNSLNPHRIEGQKTAAFELLDELDAPVDALCIPVGNAGNITAYWRGFTEAGEKPRMLGYQAAGSAPLVHGQPVAHPETVASAIRIGNPARWEDAMAAITSSGGAVKPVSDEQILAAYRFLADHEGVFCEPASAASVAGLLTHGTHGARTVVCVLTGHGLKDPQTALAEAGSIVPCDPDLEDLERAVLT